MKEKEKKNTAIMMIKEVCDMRERILGNMNRSTLDANYEFALSLKSVNRDREALTVFEETLIGQEKVLG